MYSITDPAYGASTASTPAANKTAIDACIAAAPAYSTILIPTGTFLTTGLHQIRQPGIRLIFEGQLKLADGGVMKNYLLSAANENIVLYTPRLDMDRANNVDQYAGVDGGGTQATLYCYAADNLIVLGGKIEGGIHNNIQGAGRNQQFLGTWLDNNGEHAVYFDGSNLGYKNFRFTNMKITNNAQKTALNRLIGAMKLESISEVYIDNLEYDAGDNNVSPSTTCVLDLLDVQTLRMRGGRARQMNAFGVQSDANCRDIQIDGTTFDWIDRAPANIVNSPSVFRSNHSRYIVSITRSGAIATVTTGETNGHRMIGGDRVTITGAGQPEYNVTNALITVTGVNSFTFRVVGSPVTPATGVFDRQEGLCCWARLGRRKAERRGTGALG